MMKIFYFLPVALLWCSCQTPEVAETFQYDGRKVIAYWHAWDSRNVPFVPLPETPPFVNQVNLAFAFPDTAASKRLIFPHNAESDAEIKSQIRGLQRRGIEVFISVGGGNHPIELKSDRERDDFVESLIAMVERFGFDGVDLNLEGPSVHLDPGDTDFRNPATPKIRYVIEAVERVDDAFQGEVLFSVAPETQYVTGGYAKYGEKFGGYLPILYALRDRLDLVHVQLYNSGSQYAYLGDPAVPPRHIVEPATPDFVVAMTEMILLGFPVGNDPEAMFPGFPAEKVVVGLSSTPEDLGNGTLTGQQLREALLHLMTGTPSDGSRYPLRRPEGHPNLKGVMTWSLNWDRLERTGTGVYSFVREAGEVLREGAGAEAAASGSGD